MRLIGWVGFIIVRAAKVVQCWRVARLTDVADNRGEVVDLVTIFDGSDDGRSFPDEITTNSNALAHAWLLA